VRATASEHGLAASAAGGSGGASAEPSSTHSLIDYQSQQGESFIMSNNVTSQILAFISGRYPQVEISSTDNIFQIGFVNSLFAMELVMFIEKTFGVTVPNDELRIENFHSAQSMTELVDRLTPATVGV
jgi:acyl carrier protein